VKTKLVRTVTVAAFVAGTFSLVTAQIPEWYATHKDGRFPAEQYILGVGSGAGDRAAESAKKAAQMDVIAQIRVQVQAEVKNVSESYKFNNDEQTFSDYRQNVRTAVSDEVTGMEIVESVTDQTAGTVYTLAVLDRNKYCQNLRGELDAGWKQVAELRNSSGDYERRGKLNEAIQSLLNVKRAIPSLLTKQTLYSAVASAPYASPVEFGPLAVSSDIRRLLSSIVLKKKSGDGQDGTIGKQFLEPFVVKVELKLDSGVVPVSGSTLVFESADKTKIGEATTDEQGIGSLTTTVRSMTGNGIQARLSFEHLGREFDDNLRSSAVYFTWKARQSDVSFALRINAKSAKMESGLTNAVSSAVTRIGYKMAKSSRFVLDVGIETSQSGSVEGMAGTMYTVSVDVVITLVDTKGGNELGSVRFSGKGLGRSESQAIEKGVTNAKVNQNELAPLLGKALQN
jgi:hypothetical protein